MQNERHATQSAAVIIYGAIPCPLFFTTDISVFLSSTGEANMSWVSSETTEVVSDISSEASLRLEVSVLVPSDAPISPSETLRLPLYSSSVPSASWLAPSCIEAKERSCLKPACSCLAPARMLRNIEKKRLRSAELRKI